MAEDSIGILLQLVLATFLGALLGLEREYKRKAAGLRTYSLVSLGAAFFIIISHYPFLLYSDQINVDFDPTRVLGQIVLGVGFLGAGLIIFRDSHIEGLTTAAGLWIAAAVGAAVGEKLYLLAAFVTFIALFILAGLTLVEEKLIDKEKNNG